MRTINLIILADDSAKARTLLDGAGILHALVPLAEATQSPPVVLTVEDFAAPAKPAKKPAKKAPKRKAKPAKRAKAAPVSAEPTSRESVLAFVTAHPGAMSEKIPGDPKERKKALRLLVADGKLRQEGKLRNTRYFPIVSHNGQNLVKVSRGPVRVRDAVTKEPKREIPGPEAAE